MLSPIMARIRPQDLVAATITMLVLTLSGTAVAASNDSPMSGQLAVRPVSQLPVTALPAVDAEQRLNEDAAKTKPGPLRYAIPIDMSVTPDKHGTWEKLADGARLWRYRVHAPGATDLNFGFTRYHLPEGATLHVISEKQDYFHGPYTHEDNRDHGQHWTPMVPGDSAVIELYLSAKATSGVDHFDLELGRVGTGYRDLFGVPNLTRQGACNIDTICPQGDNWRDEIRSAGQYSLGGSFFCSGTIIMDVPGGFAPWWITANHCGLNAGNASSLVVLWNFEAAVCGALSGGIATDTQSGATWRAARSDADFTLLQLNSTPPPAFGVYYSGWDATGAVPQSSMGISHPSNDEKALAINDDPLGTTASCIGGATPNTHWNVGNYELGMTEPGSSGSGIWNPYSTDPLVPNNPKLVGVLSGGSAACNGGIPNTGFDCYGKFSVAWDGTGASTRLRDWLDPAGTGTLMVDGADPNGPAVCGDGQLGTGEQCDDGNTGSGDGCSSSCQVEPGFICTGEPS
ncbi:MAG: myxococcus cysteine-rich repeat containing protein, partial [Gammaproteobacteria bacterium]|nr:myxococcus cysteine-rich repeat containing protein [Gammaproteobacteria bacterium]